jgi:hypothetical protein
MLTQDRENFQQSGGRIQDPLSDEGSYTPTALVSNTVSTAAKKCQALFVSMCLYINKIDVAY